MMKIQVSKGGINSAGQSRKSKIASFSFICPNSSSFPELTFFYENSKQS